MVSLWLLGVIDSYVVFWLTVSIMPNPVVLVRLLL